jgi:hypothetical protein
MVEPKHSTELGREQIGDTTVTPRTIAPAASWTYKLDSDQKQEHDFSNLISELSYAVRIPGQGEHHSGVKPNGIPG